MWPRFGRAGARHCRHAAMARSLRTANRTPRQRRHSAPGTGCKQAKPTAATNCETDPPRNASSTANSERSDILKDGSETARQASSGLGACL